MIRLLTDEDFREQYAAALRARLPPGSITRVVDAGLAGAADPEVLRFAAEQGLVVISHDRRTLIGAAYARIRRGERFPGLIILNQIQPGGIIDEIELLVRAGRREDFENQVRYLPFT